MSERPLHVAAAAPAAEPAPAGIAAPEPVAPAVPATAVTTGVLTETSLSGIRAVIAERMHASHQITAPVTLTMEVDATALVALRESLKASLAKELGFNLGYNDLLVKLAAKALREFPYMNAQLDDEAGVIRQLDAVHVGLAIDTERGLLVPHVSDADKKGVVEIAKDIRAMVERARTGRSLPDELAGGTFTITNLGMYDVDGFTPIINHPESAILGVGRIKAAPAVVDGEVAVRQMMWLSLDVRPPAGRRRARRAVHAVREAVDRGALPASGVDSPLFCIAEKHAHPVPCFSFCRSAVSWPL